MAALKAAAAGALRRQGCVDQQRPIWTAHGSTRHIFAREALEPSVNYVAYDQGTNLDGAWFVSPAFERHER